MLLLIFLGASFLFTLLFFKTILLYWLIVLGLAAAYYSGFTRLQYVPILSTLTFFAMNLFAFAAGYGAILGINLNGFIFGTYFALVMLKQFFNIQVIDVQVLYYRLYSWDNDHYSFLGTLGISFSRHFRQFPA